MRCFIPLSSGYFFTKESHLAADPTDASEQFHLAEMYRCGEGVPQDNTEAIVLRARG